MSDPKLLTELARALNVNCAENVSNTPDFILARFLANCLFAFDQATHERENWYGVHHAPGAGSRISNAVGVESQAQPDDFPLSEPSQERVDAVTDVCLKSLRRNREVAPEPSPGADLVRRLRDHMHPLTHEAAAALEALTAELAEWQTLGGTKLYERWQSELLRAERAEAALEAQRGEIAKMAADYEELRDLHDTKMAARDAQIEQWSEYGSKHRADASAARELAEQYRVDAERYKWLRMCMAGEWDKLNGVRLDKSVIALDAAIDARRALGADQP